MKNAIYAIVVLVVVLIAIIVVKNANRAREEQKTAFEKPTQSKGLMSEAERARRMKQMIAKKGALPIEIALKNATTEEAKERLRKKFAYQSKTKAEAISEAEEKIGQIEHKLDTLEDGSEREKLERQKQALLQVIANLEGSD